MEQTPDFRSCHTHGPVCSAKEHQIQKKKESGTDDLPPNQQPVSDTGTRTRPGRGKPWQDPYFHGILYVQAQYKLLSSHYFSLAGRFFAVCCVMYSSEPRAGSHLEERTCNVDNRSERHEQSTLSHWPRHCPIGGCTPFLISVFITCEAPRYKQTRNQDPSRNMDSALAPSRSFPPFSMIPFPSTSSRRSRIASAIQWNRGHLVILGKRLPSRQCFHASECMDIAIRNSHPPTASKNCSQTAMAHPTSSVNLSSPTGHCPTAYVQHPNVQASPGLIVVELDTSR